MDFSSIINGAVQLGGALAAGKLTQEQFNLFQQQLADVHGISLPDLKNIVATHLGPSAMESIPQDTGLKDQQLESLGTLQDIIDQGGMTLADQVAQEAATSKAQAADRSSRASIANSLQSRGQLNSGANLVLQGQAGQSFANASRQSGQEAAAAAQARRLQALDDVSNTAGKVRSEDFSEASQKAKSQDAINQWNAGAAEKANYYNAGLPQQQFTNEMSKVGAAANPTNNLAGAYANEASGVRSTAAGLGNAAGSAFGSSGSGTNGSGTYNWGANGYDPSTNPNGPGGGAPAYPGGDGTSTEDEWDKYPGA